MDVIAELFESLKESEFKSDPDNPLKKEKEFKPISETVDEEKEHKGYIKCWKCNGTGYYGSKRDLEYKEKERKAAPVMETIYLLTYDVDDMVMSLTFTLLSRKPKKETIEIYLRKLIEVLELKDRNPRFDKKDKAYCRPDPICRRLTLDTDAILTFRYNNQSYLLMEGCLYSFERMKRAMTPFMDHLFDDVDIYEYLEEVKNPLIF